ncbi:MAG TPA: hypothetical protein VK742_05715, partial [Candidatus Sulfotelmatobacter sp.]|nr:hypothetical protein [Candidatus Sulfotelmatobacter sp.]
QLHALDLTSGAEKFGGPVTITASVPGNGDGSVDNVMSFNPFREHNRPGLLLYHGIVYIAFASLADLGPFHGWVLGYDATTLAQKAVFNANPNGADAGIWEAGCAPAADTNGNIYVATGNGTFDAATNNDYGDSLLKLSTTNGLQLADFFTPSNQVDMNLNDIDLGSGGIILLPDSAGSADHPHLIICSSKTGSIYMADRDNLTHYQPTGDQIVQEVPSPFKGASTPVYFNNTLYFIRAKDKLTAFSLTNAFIGETIISNDLTTYSPAGATPSLSSCGNSNAIIWAIENAAGTAVLHAYDAANIPAPDLYNSDLAGQNPGPMNSFEVPTVANGKVYVGTATNVSVFGLISPAITNQPQNQAVAIGDGAVFSVGALGREDLHYQWRKDHADLAQATNAALAVSNVQWTDVGSYSVVVTDSVGVAVSVDASLTVTNLAPGQSRVIGFQMFGGGSNLITFIGTPFYIYSVQWSSNLGTGFWFNLSTNTAGINGLWQVNDDTATNPMRLYRALWP